MKDKSTLGSSENSENDDLIAEQESLADEHSRKPHDQGPCEMPKFYDECPMHGPYWGRGCPYPPPHE